MSTCKTAHRRSLDNPQEFWAKAVACIDWDTKSDRVLDDTHAQFYRWFLQADD